MFLWQVCGPVRHVPEDVCARLSGSHRRTKAGWRWLPGEMFKHVFFQIIFIAHPFQVNVFLQATKSNGRNCRGKLRDFVLDWEAELPQEVCILMPRILSFHTSPLSEAFSVFSIFPGPWHVGHPQHASRPKYCLGFNFAGAFFAQLCLCSFL